MAAQATLITIPFSHYCEKARWALQYAGVPFREEGHAPGFHWWAVRRMGGGKTVPLLVCEGRALGDSSLIVAYADAFAPSDRRLYPESAPDRAEVLALEERFDEGLGPHVRRVVYFHVLPDRAVTLRLMDHATPLWQRALLRVVLPRLRQKMQRYMKITEKESAESWKAVQRVFDEVSAHLADGRRYLVGDRFTAADLTFASLAAPGLVPDEYGVPLPRDMMSGELTKLVEELRATTAGQFALRMYREHRGRER